MQYLQRDIKTFQRTCKTPYKDKSFVRTSPSAIHREQRALSNISRSFISDQCPKTNQSSPDHNQNFTTYESFQEQQQASEEGHEQWAQIKLIVNKISNLQTALKVEKKLNKELNKKLKLCEMKIKAHEEETRLQFEQSKKNTLKYKNLLSQLKHQHENLRLKDDELAKSKETLSQIQMSMLKRISEVEQKLKKGAQENKELTEKLRKSNIQLQKQRNSNRQLKKEMTTKIQNMQSNKQNYLLQQISNLKSVIDSSKDDKQLCYLQEIAGLSHKLYQCQQDLKISSIQLNLMERKKQQAVKQICDKKDQEIKVQKAMFKTLNEKLAKMQEDFKKMKKPDAKSNKVNSRRQQEFLLELSPEK